MDAYRRVNHIALSHLLTIKDERWDRIITKERQELESAPYAPHESFFIRGIFRESIMPPLIWFISDISPYATQLEWTALWLEDLDILTWSVITANFHSYEHFLSLFFKNLIFSKLDMKASIIKAQILYEKKCDLKGHWMLYFYAKIFLVNDYLSSDFVENFCDCEC